MSPRPVVTEPERGRKEGKNQRHGTDPARLSHGPLTCQSPKRTALRRALGNSHRGWKTVGGGFRSVAAERQGNVAGEGQGIGHNRPARGGAPKGTHVSGYCGPTGNGTRGGVGFGRSVDGIAAGTSGLSLTPSTSPLPFVLACEEAA